MERLYSLEPKLLDTARRHELVEAATARSRRSTRSAFGRVRASAVRALLIDDPVPPAVIEAFNGRAAATTREP